MTSTKEKQFTQAYLDYADIIVKHIYFRVSNWDIAEDLGQEVFTKAWQAATLKHEDIQDMKKYLYRIANNIIIDHYRQKSKQALYLEDMKNQAIVFYPDQEVELDKAAARGVITKYLQYARASYRKILEYYFLENKSIEEISELTGKSVNHVSVIKYRGIKMLKRNLSHAAMG